jgi:hypothetical protein
MHVVQCGHCGERVQVNAWSEPVSYAEREAENGRRKLVIIGGDGLLHQCLIDETRLNRAPSSGPTTQQPSTPRAVESNRMRRALRANRSTDGLR